MPVWQRETRLIGSAKVKYAIDLSPRQAARVFEQGIHSHATILLEPSVWGYFDGLKGFVASGDSHALAVEITEPAPQPLEGVRGLYCDVEMLLGGHRYMFCADIIDVRQLPDGQTLVLSRPKTLQVAQRRRFRRAGLAEPSAVHLVPPNGQANAQVALLFNISPEGMACRATRETADAVLIGDVVSVAFELPGCSHHFELRATVCNKTPAATDERIILGMQFVRDAPDAPTAEALQRLEEFLAEHHQAASDRG